MTELVEWEQVRPAVGLGITATPGRHSAPENTYIIESEGRTVFVGGDSRLVPGLHRWPAAIHTSTSPFCP